MYWGVSSYLLLHIVLHWIAFSICHFIFLTVYLWGRLRGGIAGSKGKGMCNLLYFAKYPSMGGVSSCIHIIHVWECLLSHSPTNRMILLNFWSFVNLIGEKLVSQYRFHLHFVMCQVFKEYLHFFVWAVLYLFPIFL